MDQRLFQAFLNPRTIALVGASGNSGKVTSRAQFFLIKHGYSGKIYPINPNRLKTHGLSCYKSLSAAPEPIDHAFIMLSGDAAIEAIDECASLGIPCATLFAGGFAESGKTGQDQQERVLGIARRGGVRILGPNSIGMINVSESVVLSPNAMLDLPVLPFGKLGVISQSGSLIGAMLSYGEARNIGFSKLISVGNEADLSVGEIGEFLVDDPLTDTILLFLETLRDSGGVAAMARRAHSEGKAVIAYKLGKSELGQQLAKSHTGAIAGSDAAFEAFVKHHGIARIQNFEALLAVPNLFKANKPLGHKCVSIVTTTGGAGAMVADCLGELGIEVSVPEDAVTSFMRSKGLPYEGSKMVDLTIAGTKPDIVSDVIDLLMANPNCDLVIMIVGSSARFRPEQAIKPLASWAHSKKPLVVYVAPHAPDALSYLSESGIPVFNTPEACADGVKAYLTWSDPKIEASPTKGAIGKINDILVQNNTSIFTEALALDVFDNLGIAVQRSRIANNPGNAAQIANEIGYPVAIKVYANDTLHKTEVGGVILGVDGQEAVQKACKTIKKNFSVTRPGFNIKGFLVQAMEVGMIEVLLGYKKDPIFGPIVVLGMGGVLAEIYCDRSVRLAPVTIDSAYEMIDEVKSLASIQGYRNGVLGDIDILAKTIVNLSILSAVSEIIEAEINPLIIKSEGQGVVAVDGLIFLNRS